MKSKLPNFILLIVNDTGLIPVSTHRFLTFLLLSFNFCLLSSQVPQGFNYQDSWKNPGSAKLWSMPYSMVAANLEGAVSKLEVIGEDGLKSVAYDKLTAVLTEAIKEQQKQIESHQREIDELKAVINTLNVAVSEK